MENFAVCPFCGEEIRVNAKVCPYCGSDEETGWSDNEYSDIPGPDDGFDYDEMVEQEFGNSNLPKFSSDKKKATLVRVTSIVLLLSALLYLLLRL